MTAALRAFRSSAAPLPSFLPSPQQERHHSAHGYTNPHGLLPLEGGVGRSGLQKVPGRQAHAQLVRLALPQTADGSPRPSGEAPIRSQSRPRVAPFPQCRVRLGYGGALDRPGPLGEKLAPDLQGECLGAQGCPALAAAAASRALLRLRPCSRFSWCPREPLESRRRCSFSTFCSRTAALASSMTPARTSSVCKPS